MDKLQEIAILNKALSLFLLVHWLFLLLSMLDYSIVAHIVPYMFFCMLLSCHLVYYTFSASYWVVHVLFEITKKCNRLGIHSLPLIGICYLKHNFEIFFRIDYL